MPITDFKYGDKGCDGCPAICCHNLAVHIGRPQNKEEREDLKWQLQFDTVKVYIRNTRWYQLVKGKCMYLNNKNRCSRYSKRMDKCREHNPSHCERYHKFYDVLMEKPEDLDKYLLKKKKKKPKKVNRS